MTAKGVPVADERKIKRSRQLLTMVTGVALGGLLGACSSGFNLGNTTPEEATGDAPTQPTPVIAFTRFPDLPIPPGGEIDLEKTFVFGSNESWFGRLTVDSTLDPNELFNFFKQEVPGFGWQEFTSIRSALSVLTYTRNRRVATIQITGRLLSGASASITVSPQESKGTPQVDQQKAPQYAPRRRMTAPVSPVQQAPTMPPVPAPVLRGR
jgi:hypothetical protein